VPKDVLPQAALDFDLRAQLVRFDVPLDKILGDLPERSGRPRCASAL
jgi:hypothetical protein